jgi:hypothetical protein
MAKGPTTRDFADQSTDRAMQVGTYGMDWMRGAAEQSLKLSKTVLESYLTTVRTTSDNIHHRASEMRERSISLATDTLTNTFDFADRVVSVKEPQEVLQLQSEFVARQVQTLAEQTKELGQIMLQGAKLASKSAVEQMRGAAE